VGKDGWLIGPTTLPRSCVDCLEILRASYFCSLQGLCRNSLTFIMDSWNSALMNVVSLGMYLLRTGYYCSSSNVERSYVRRTLPVTITNSLKLELRSQLFVYQSNVYQLEPLTLKCNPSGKCLHEVDVTPLRAKADNSLRKPPH